MLTVHRAKSIQGTIHLPPDPDLFCIAALVAISRKQAIRITPVALTPAFKQWAAVLSSCATFSFEETACALTINPETDDVPVVFENDLFPYRDLIIFMTLGVKKQIAFQTISDARITRIIEKAKSIGTELTAVKKQDQTLIRLNGGINYDRFGALLNEESALIALGLACGLGAKISFRTSVTVATPLREIAKTFGCEILVKRDSTEQEQDPLLRRMRLQQGKRLSLEDQVFTITADFSTPANDEPLSITLPGDLLLASHFMVLKAVMLKGSLMIDNVLLESWATPTLSFLRKMGCKPSVQETSRSGFGATGVVTIQQSELTGQKIECRPIDHYLLQVPALIVMSTFATGQSVIRGLEDLRNNSPNTLSSLEKCLKSMNVKFGEMPDGIVIQGASDYDGFDVEGPLESFIAGAFAMAGLHAMGSTTIPDDDILKRWPQFQEIINQVCEFRTP